MILHLEMSAKELKKSTASLHQEVMSTKAEYFRIKDRLDRLDKQYQDSKKYKPLQRYTVMKNIIKDLCDVVEGNNNSELGKSERGAEGGRVLS